jgi:hypothetical protein
MSHRVFLLGASIRLGFDLLRRKAEILQEGQQYFAFCLVKVCRVASVLFLQLEFEHIRNAVGCTGAIAGRTRSAVSGTSGRNSSSLRIRV